MLFHEHGDPFMAPEDEDKIYNLLTKEVMTEKVSKTFWNETRLDKACLWNSSPSDLQTLCVGQNDKEEV